MSAVDPAVFVPRHHAPRQPDDPFGGCFRERGTADAARGYRVRSEDTWGFARQDYEAGYSAEAICKSYDLGLSAFRQRARREGWRRCDTAEAEGGPVDIAEPDPAPPTPDLIDLTWRSMAEAIKLGDVYKARAWMKLHAELKAVVENEAKNEAWRASLAASRAAGTAGLAGAAVEPPAPAAADTFEADIKAMTATIRAHTRRMNALCTEKDEAEEDAFEGYRYDDEDEIDFDFGGEEEGGETPTGLHRLHPESGVQSASLSAEALTLPISADVKIGALSLRPETGRGAQAPSASPAFGRGRGGPSVTAMGE